MIELIKQGPYRLIMSKEGNKILYLGRQCFIWLPAGFIGELLILTKHGHLADYVLSQGRFRLYQVHQEAKLVDLPHLELSIGNNLWQGYLLLTGLPNKQKPKKRIVPTTEVITKSR